MYMTNFELVRRPNGVRVKANVDGKHETLAFVETQEQAEAFVEKCEAYNKGVYCNEVFEALNSLRMP